MAARKLRTTPSSRAKAVADKYIRPKGGKAEGKPAPPEEFELSAAAEAKGKGKPPPEIRIVERAAPAPAFTAKEARFVDEYIVDLNATQAAIRAGYAKKSAAQIGYENLRKPHIAAAVERAKRERAERLGVTVDSVLADLVRDRHADIADLLDANGALKPVEHWPIEFRTGLVAGLDIEELYAGTGEERIRVGQLKKLRFADRTPIKKLIGDHVGVQAWNHRRTLEVEEGSMLAQMMRELGGRSIRPTPERGAATPPKPGGIRPKAG